ncbi:hypothetical protein GCM10020254_26020 [Streptomyces goshikiensis]
MAEASKGTRAGSSSSEAGGQGGGRDGAHVVLRDLLGPQGERGEALRLGEQAEDEVLGADLGAAAGAGLVLRGDDDVAGAGGEAAEALARVHAAFALLVGLGDEALLGGLAGDAHAAADVGPGGAGAAGLVDEVTDEVVGHVAEGLGDDDGAAELLQGVGVDLLDGLDQVVEAYRVGHANGFHRRVRHGCNRRLTVQGVSTLGCQSGGCRLDAGSGVGPGLASGVGPGVVRLTGKSNIYSHELSTAEAGVEAHCQWQALASMA